MRSGHSSLVFVSRDRKNLLTGATTIISHAPLLSHDEGLVLGPMVEHQIGSEVRVDQKSDSESTTNSSWDLWLPKATSD